ncbi:MAG: hypothetical protein ABL863_05745, partial [Nitrosomonas sp.]
MQLFKIIFLVVAASALPMNPVFSQQNTPASDYPIFKDGKLTIPRIDTEEQAGNYQKAEFQFDDSTNSWKLLNYIETKIVPGPATYEEKVE